MGSAVVHYAGALAWVDGKRIVQIAPGFAACCSGDKAVEIAKRGAHTYVATETTCKACVACIEKAARKPKTKPA